MVRVAAARRSRRPRSRCARRAPWRDSNSSRIRTAPPSPMTNPSRSRSKGREACSGSSLRREVALIGSKQAIEIGEIGDSDGAGDHDVGLAVLDQLVAVADRVDPDVQPVEITEPPAVGAELERDLARQAARHQPWIEEGRRVVGVDEPLLAAVADRDVAVLEDHRPADGRAEASPPCARGRRPRGRARCRRSPPCRPRPRTGCSGPCGAPRAR